MKTLNFCQAFGIGAAAAILTACGGSVQTLVSVPSSQMGADQATKALSAAVGAPRHHHSMTFNYTGAQQNFTVPAGVTHVTVKAYGGGSVSGAGGGYVKATISVTSGESLAVFVGGNASGSSGGFNGGGNGGLRQQGGYGDGGAGASDVRQGGTAFANRVIVAGGEGGDGQLGEPGGAGGGLIGGSGGGPGGTGGSQSSGGTGGRGCPQCGGRGSDGALGIGGEGGSTPGGAWTAGGGGGGGYYGGGGGGAGHYLGGGGGGGSSYTEPSAKNVINQQGASTAGSIMIFW